MSASDERMRESYAHCESLVREHDHDRWLASLFEPADGRPHLHALYAFDHEIALVPHRVHEALAGEMRLQWWRDALAGEARGDASANPVAAAWLTPANSKHRFTCISTRLASRWIRLAKI